MIGLRGICCKTDMISDQWTESNDTQPQLMYKENTVARSLTLQKQLSRYTPVSLNAELTGLTDSDKEALVFIVKAASVMDEIFYLQSWYSNPALRDWLKDHADKSELNKLKWSYYQINKSPWSCLDDDEAFLTTADSEIRLLSKATRTVSEWKGLEYRVAFPILKPAGANFYPPDMDKMEFNLWNDSLEKDQQTEATSFFTVIKRHSELILDSGLSNDKVASSKDLYIVPYSQEYKSLLAKAAKLLHKAGDITNSTSLKKLLHSKADAFLSNDYYESDIAWMKLVSQYCPSYFYDPKNSCQAGEINVLTFVLIHVVIHDMETLHRLINFTNL
ncbi:unnamed protein product [Vicia faba]|uniref:Uncharacterized protein n=1 Tax=Vicia faba TaxID=3906 RepID=A0AAV0ZGJ6_VICFA|nr:unnamed protein product [Vicia faba]